MDIEEFMENHFGQCSGCRHMETWQENLAPHGAGRRMEYTFAGCGHSVAMDDPTLPSEAGKDGDTPCPYFASNLNRCKDHGHYRDFGEGCPGCINEAENEEEGKRSITNWNS